MILIISSLLNVSVWSVLNWLATPGRSFSFWSVLISSSVGLGLFALILLITGRPFSSSLITMLIALIIWAGNHLKQKILSEPLVFSDAMLAKEACTHPRLYFGYAPLYVWPVVALGVALVVWLVFIERGFFQSPGIRVIFCLTALTFSVVLIALYINHFRFTRLTFDANKDAAHLSPLGAFFIHCAYHLKNRKSIRRRISTRTNEKFGSEHQEESLSAQKHLLLIQAESFCDLCKDRNGHSFIPNFERLAAKFSSGHLELPWRGAYTMRTEFSVLTGIPSEELESYAFDPYLLCAASPVESIATKANKLGYNTVVWHPNDKNFFNREKVMKNLGFREFVGIEGFADLPLNGRYISDEALLKKAGNWLIEQKENTFLFVITMEAHGPWDKNRFVAADRMHEEERYGFHLSSIDRGLANVLELVEKGKLTGVVGFYGDHLPGLKRLTQDKATSKTPWLLAGGTSIVHRTFDLCAFNRLICEEAFA